MADAKADAPATVPLIDPRDNRIYSVAADKADLYRGAGWGAVDAGPRVNSEEIHQSLSGWADNSQAVAFTIAKGVPLMVKLGSKVLNANTFQRLASKAQVFDQDHPILSTALQVGAGLGTAALGGAAIRGLGAVAEGAGALGEAAGVGGEAAAGAAGVAGEGTAAAAANEGAGAAAAADSGGGALQQALASEGAAGEGAASSGASAAGEPIVDPASGVIGAGEAAPAAETAASTATAAESTGAGDAAAAGAETVNSGNTLSDLLSRAGTRIAESKLAKAAAIGAGANTAYGLAYKIDAQAIDHALDPQGQEKLMFSANDMLFDAAIGAAIPVGVSAIGKAIGKTGRKLTDNSINMFRNAMIKNSSMDQIAAQGREATLASTLDPLMGKSQEYVFTATKSAQETAEQQMNIIKAKYKGIDGNPGLTLNGDEKTSIITNLKKVLGTDKDPIFTDSYATLVKPNVDLLELQRLAKKLSKRIVWKDPKFGDNVTNLKYRDARQVIADAQVDLIKRGDISQAGDAQRWAGLNQISSDNQLINDALRSRRGQNVDDLLRNMGSSAIAGGIAGALGANGVGIAASALRSGSWAGVHNIKAQHLAPFANALGKGMLNVDSKIAQTIEAGLYGFPAQAHKLTDRSDYDTAAAAISLAAQDPSQTVANLQNHLDGQGIPQEISVPIVQGQSAGLAHLAGSIPKRNDAPDMATRDRGDPVQQHRWLDQVRTFQDPTYGIATPTADNLRILKQFYPQTLYSAQQALYQQIAKNPDLPSDARAWGSALLERPIGNLDSPTFAQSLRQARQAEAQQAAQAGGGGKPGGGKGSANAVQSSETRVDQLQNRD